MGTEKEPDFAGIARALTAKAHPYSDNCSRFVTDNMRWIYFPCMEARLRSDWETITDLRRLLEAEELELLTWKCECEEEHGITCGVCATFTALSAHLSKLLEPFTP